MKTYILYDYIPVELQKSRPRTSRTSPQQTPPTPEPATAGATPASPAPSLPADPPPPTPTSLAEVSSRGSQPSALILFLGLDVHTASIAVSIAPSNSTEVRRYGVIGGTHDDVLKVLKKLQAAHAGATLKFCYEAGPHGYPLWRCLCAHGFEGIVVCPSKVPRKQIGRAHV